VVDAAGEAVRRALLSAVVGGERGTHRRRPGRPQGVGVEVSSSLGVVPRVGDLSAALARADAAMYRAKLRGGGVEVAAD